METKSLKKQYEKTQRDAEKFTDALKKELENLLATRSISLGVPIESRTKTWTSIADKIKKRSLNLSTILELNDLVGIRVILLFKRDIETIRELISKTFVVISQKDTAARLNESQFGYQSLHYVISFPKKWLEIPSFREFNDFKAEVQIRTLAQHLWAAASHKLQYKQELSVPAPVRRSIHRVSALLETIDLEFERVLSERETYLKNINIQNSNEVLNVDLLKQTLDLLLPKLNKELDEPYSELLQELNSCKVNKKRDLEQLIDKHIEKALEEDKKRAKSELKEFEESVVPLHVSLTKLVNGAYFSYVGLVRIILGYEFEGFDQRRIRMQLAKKGK